MKAYVRPSVLQGDVVVPASKSHTIRAVVIASLAEGESLIERPLDSADAQAARRVFGMLGASIAESKGGWRVFGTGGRIQPPEDILNVENSGTTLRIALGTASLLNSGMAVFTGDYQVRRRPCGALAQALTALGARVDSTRGNGCAPLVVSGKLRGGETTIEAVTSQFVSSLLINTPLAEKDTVLHVPLLNEKPYVEITLHWLKKQGISVSHDSNLSEFYVPGCQLYKTVRCAVPADFSSATFFLAAGALPGNDIRCVGLDMTDPQGDKVVVEFLKAMGACVEIHTNEIRVKASQLRGCEFDMNATPDALPMMAALACLAEGTTQLLNVPQARLKETDRIHVMRLELEKLGAKIRELDDGLVIEGSKLLGGVVDGHGDHRVVMALAVAATAAEGEVAILGAEAINVTYPEFMSHLQQLGGNVTLTD